MATRMGIRQLRDTLTSTIRRVQVGETIEVTHHGDPVAVLSPLQSDRLDRLIARGDVTPGTPLDGPLEPHRPIGELTASDVLQEDRAQR